MAARIELSIYEAEIIKLCLIRRGIDELEEGLELSAEGMPDEARACREFGDNLLAIGDVVREAIKRAT